MNFETFKSFSGYLDITIILIVMFFIYKTFKDTNLFRIFLGFLFLALLKRTAIFFELKITGQAIGFILDNALVVLLIIFQEDLRKFFQRVNKTFLMNKNDKVFKTSSEVISDACFYMAGKRTGALLIFENEISIKDHSTGSILLNCDLGYEILLSIFEKRSVLHDGAIVISNDKIVSARNVIPLSDQTSDSFKYGTRHRAALGISEITDCFVVVISEERGEVRVVSNGELGPKLTKEELKIILNEKLSNTQKSSSNKLGLIADSISNIIKKFRK